MTLRNRSVLRFPVGALCLLAMASAPFACAAPSAPDEHEHEVEPVGEVSQELVKYDCTERQDTGYSNGKPFTITVVTVDGKPVETATANAFLTMAAAAEKAGITLHINYGFRTYAEQQYLYNCYINKNCNNGNLAAKPGYSNHQSGHALDLQTGGGALAWLNEHGATYGFKRTVPSENWHWEWWGGGNPKAYCGCKPSTEICDGKDNDCDNQTDEGEVCEQAHLTALTTAYAPPSTTDVDGDGRADLCARAADGVHCWSGLASGSFDVDSGKMLIPLSDASGWSDASNYATIRLGDIDGDERADLCARGNSGVLCWTSETSPFGTAIVGPKWSDDSGWTSASYFSTVRLVDIDGDGRDDLCARAAKGIVCHRSSGTAFGAEIAGPAWSDASGFDSAKYYGTLRAGDVTGDGKEDLCIRAAKGILCAPATPTGDGFEPTFDGPAWSDAAGWGDLMYWSSIRLVDVDGDGKADICARRAKGLVCHLSTGKGFGPELEVAALSNDKGWSDPGNYLTLRTGDIDGDGHDDLCIRANANVLCWAYHDGTFVSVTGPAWSDTSGWNVPEHYETLRVADVDGDGKADVCGRAASGVVCARSTGSGFEAATSTSVLTNAAGWNKQPYYGAIFLASPTCKPDTEVCNGHDDDCDGEVDEGEVCAGASGASGAGGVSGTGAAGGTGGAAGTGQAGAGQAGSGQAGSAPTGEPAGAGGDGGPLGSGGLGASGGAAPSSSASGGQAGQAGEAAGEPRVLPSDVSGEEGSCSIAGALGAPRAPSLSQADETESTRGRGSLPGPIGAVLGLVAIAATRRRSSRGARRA